MTNHLAVYSRNKSKDYIEMMLNGIKIVDIKLSYRRLAPYKYIEPGDYMYIKESSGPVVGRVLIPSVEYYEIYDPHQILEILMTIREEVGLGDEESAIRMFNKVNDRKYATVFGLDQPERLEQPIKIEKSDRRVWVPNFEPNIELKMALGLELRAEDSIRYLEDTEIR